jgi:hydrogenase-4 component F
VSGLLLMAGALALAGFPPFNIFVSEFLVFAAGLQSGYIGLMIVCALFFTITVAGLIQIIAGSVLGKRPEAMPKGDVGWLSLGPMVVLFGLVLVMGFAIPRPLSGLIRDATALVLDGGTQVAVGEPWPFQVQLLGPPPIYSPPVGLQRRAELMGPRSLLISAPHLELHK